MPARAEETSMSALARALIAFAAGGVAGFIGETLVTGEPRYSHFFDKQAIPFLPIYGFGAAAVAAVAPEIQDAPWFVRGLFYAAGLTTIEMIGCAIDRNAGKPSWNYNSAASAAGGCVSLPHAVLWGALGLAVDAAVTI